MEIGFTITYIYIIYQFKKLTPKEYQKQYSRCSETPNFKIGNTAFSTVTINYNYRSLL